MVNLEASIHIKFNNQQPQQLSSRINDSNNDQVENCEHQQQPLQPSWRNVGEKQRRYPRAVYRTTLYDAKPRKEKTGRCVSRAR